MLGTGVVLSGIAFFLAGEEGSSYTAKILRRIAEMRCGICRAKVQHASRGQIREAYLKEVKFTVKIVSVF